MPLLSRRSKSVSNVIETPTLNANNVRDSIEYRYKSCSSNDLSADEQSKLDTSVSIQKSQKFFTKLVASLEKRSNKKGDFNADDEFLATCYTKSLLPRINTHYPSSGSSTNDLYNQRGYSLDERKTFEPDIKVVNTFKEPFEPSDIRSIHDADKNWTAMKKESSDVVNEKKINRKGSIKRMFNFIMKWKKHTEKEKPRRFRSCDELEVGEKFSSMTIPIIPRARSLQSFASNSTKDEIVIESLNRNATIRPFYGSRRNHRTTPQKFLPSNHLKTIPFKEDSGYGSGFFSVEESDDNLVKPSAVREIARRLSYHPEQPWNKKNDIGLCKQVLNDREIEKNSYRRKSFVEEISDVGNYQSLDLANGSIYTLPVTRKLKDEYLSVLANKRLSVGYEKTRIALYCSQRDHP